MILQDVTPSTTAYFEDRIWRMRSQNLATWRLYSASARGLWRPFDRFGRSPSGMVSSPTVWKCSVNRATSRDRSTYAADPFGSFSGAILRQPHDFTAPLFRLPAVTTVSVLQSHLQIQRALPPLLFSSRSITVKRLKR